MSFYFKMKVETTVVILVVLAALFAVCSAASYNHEVSYSAKSHADSEEHVSLYTFSDEIDHHMTRHLNRFALRTFSDWSA